MFISKNQDGTKSRRETDQIEDERRDHWMGKKIDRHTAAESEKHQRLQNVTQDFPEQIYCQLMKLQIMTVNSNPFAKNILLNLPLHFSVQCQSSDNLI